MLLSAHLSRRAAPRPDVLSYDGGRERRDDCANASSGGRKSRRFDLPDSVSRASRRIFEQLARWNRKINLTALPLDGDGSDEAVDRLLIEPPWRRATSPASAKSLLDIGSGGGSPAIPVKLAGRTWPLTMVEVKVRKSVVPAPGAARSLGLQRTQVRRRDSKRCWRGPISTSPSTS